MINVLILKKFSGAVGPAIFLAAVPFVHCSREAAIILFAVGISMTSFYYTGTRINTLDLAPNYSGTIMGIVNGIGAIPGVIVPHIEDDLIINVQLTILLNHFYRFLFRTPSTNGKPCSGYISLYCFVRVFFL